MNEEDSDLEKEFRELLEAETFVDLDKLRDLSRHGIPEALRGEVWKYLLSVASPDKSEEVTKLKRLRKSYDAVNKKVIVRIKREIYATYFDQKTMKTRAFAGLPEKQLLFEQVLMAYFYYHDVPYDQGFIFVLAPFVRSIVKNLRVVDLEHDIYYSFQALMSKLHPLFLISPELNYEGELITSIVRSLTLVIVAKLQMLFRHTQPDLHAYFEREEIEPNEWALNWIRYLLSAELPLNCVSRLWDTYFASNDLDLHPYVCLSVLQHHHETLMELEYSEICFYLSNLPEMNMDHIIKQAHNIRALVKARDWL
ncbi:hypothetical protein AKO1_012687 [Acrasis kona]|uniref:Rab-GAP TBC domain-containing protein n=1 Tax=Acrasis kona TaxID=1008807 RepID=A0AAW2YWN4_9EUKA